MFIVASGPSELHAHINLDSRIAELASDGRRLQVRVLTASESDGHWSVLAEVGARAVRKEGR